ncbi:MAG: cell division protein FtsA [Hyphomonadaceae bacterium]
MAALAIQMRDCADDVVVDGLPPLLAALDVGVSKTVCLAARRDPVLDLHPERPMRVLGVGQQTAPAIASGKPADFDACARAIQVAIDEAAAMAGAPVARVVACYSGPGLTSRIVRGAVRVRGQAISGRDVENVMHAAAQMGASAQQSVLHVEPLRYRIDDGDPLDDPHGFPGKMLALDACIVTAPTEAINALKACVRLAGAQVEDIIAAPHAAGLAALTPHEREDGALLLDLGAGSVGIAAFTDDSLVHAETLTVGGVRLTRDLAQKLQTTFAAAERVKLHFGALGGACDPREAVQAPKIGMDGRLEAATTLRGVIADTITPRVLEMLLLARQQLSRAGFAGTAGPQRAVLVGGGAQIPGIRELAMEALGMPVRLGRPLELSGFDHSEAGPAYAAAAGVLRWRMDNPDLEAVDDGFEPTFAQAAASVRNGVHGMWTWLRENF